MLCTHLIELWGLVGVPLKICFKATPSARDISVFVEGFDSGIYKSCFNDLSLSLSGSNFPHVNWTLEPTAPALRLEKFFSLKETIDFHNMLTLILTTSYHKSFCPEGRDISDEPQFFFIVTA